VSPQPLTERQAEVLGFIRDFIAERGYSPTLQEISDEFGFSSTASAQKHVTLLMKKGHLTRVKYQRRGLVPRECPGCRMLRKVVDAAVLAYEASTGSEQRYIGWLGETMLDLRRAVR
jgi:repressor LexA